MKRSIFIGLILFLLAPVCFSGDRDSRQQPQRVMDVIGVKKGMVIGVAGAGHGYFTFKMSKRVGDTGRIYANEIDRDCLDYIERKSRRNGIKNITPILGEVEDPLFPQGKMDMVFMCYVFHDLAKPVEFLINIKPSLKEGATVVIMDQDPGKTGSYHFLTKDVLISKVEDAGYEIVKVETFLKQDNIYICRPRDR